MNIKEAKQETFPTRYKSILVKILMAIISCHLSDRRPILLIGPPGIGKTAIMEQAARECGIGLVAYTITHHTRQSAVGLPVIVKKNFQGKEYSVTEYTMSEIIASVYEKIEETGCKEGILLSMRSTVYPKRWFPLCCSFCKIKHLVPIRFHLAGSLLPPEILLNTINLPENLILSLWTA